MNGTFRRLNTGFTLLAGIILFSACSSVRVVTDPVVMPVNGESAKVRTEKALAYNVAIQIDAPPQQVWDVLVAADAYTDWNSTVISLTGDIALEEDIAIVVHEDPDRTFELVVSEFIAPNHMVWEDGNAMFRGVRTFSLRDHEGGTAFAMEEVFSGKMLGMIEGELPDFRKSFEKFASDLKTEVESSSRP